MIRVEPLAEVPLREVWPDEAKDFTPWPAEHPGHLGRALHMDLELQGGEVAVGSFSAEVVLRDANSGHLVVVEDLLEPTDRDNLDKLITYAAGPKVHWAVLFAKLFRPEHRSVLVRLNDKSEEGSCFLGVEVRAEQLDVVVERDDFSRRARAAAGMVSAWSAGCVESWAEFLAAFREAHPGWSNAQKPQPANWMNFPASRSGVRYGLRFAYLTGATNYSLRAEVYVDNGEAVFSLLAAQRAAIENGCGLVPRWEPLENAQASRVAAYLDPADPADQTSWPTHRSWAIETLGKLRRVFAAFDQQIEPAMVVRAS